VNWKGNTAGETFAGVPARAQGKRDDAEVEGPAAEDIIPAVRAGDGDARVN
jgi:hypothetical protein